MPEQVRLFLVALQFYSRIPVTGRLAGQTAWDAGTLGRATRYFPLVGIVVAIGQGVVYVLSSIVLPHPVSLLLAIGAGLLMTGAAHEVGWADFCDAVGGRTERQRTLEILRASRLGAYGAIGVVLLLMTRFETLAHIDADWIAASFVCAAAFSRGCATLVMTTLPGAPEQDDADAQSVARNVGTRDALIALGCAVAPLLILAAWTGDASPAMLGLSFALLATASMRRLIRRRLGGFTGAGLGAVQQVAEAAFMVGLLVVLGASVEDLAAVDDES